MVHHAVYFIVHFSALKSWVNRLRWSVKFIIVFTLKLKYAKLLLVLTYITIHCRILFAIGDQFWEVWSIRNQLETTGSEDGFPTYELVIPEAKDSVLRCSARESTAILDNGPLLWRLHEVCQCICLAVDEGCIVELLNRNTVWLTTVHLERLLIHS